MKPFYFAAALPLAMVVPMMAAGIGAANAQQASDPAQAFIKEWGAVRASDVVSAASHDHVEEAAQKLLSDYERLQTEAKKAKDELAASESRLQWTLDNWVPKAAMTDKSSP